MKSLPCAVASTSHVAWWNVCVATRTTVNPVFTIACITCSWNNSAARRVPHSASCNCHTTPCSSSSSSLEGQPKRPHPAMHGSMRSTRRGHCTICFSGLSTAWPRSSTLVIRNTIHESPQCYPFVSAKNQALTKTDSSTFRL